MKSKSIVILLLFCCNILNLFAQDNEITLKLMDPAPAFKPLRWLKGNPIEKLVQISSCGFAYQR